MISVSEAKKIIQKNVIPLSPVRLGLQLAADKVLAEDIYAAYDIPAFPQSSMDGYAFAFDQWQQTKTLFVEGELAAGSAEHLQIKHGQAIRIFTGAPVPLGADTVVMQEKVNVKNDLLFIEDYELKKGANVRHRGSEIKVGDLALPKESLLTSAAIGFLAGIGIAEVSVYPNPEISIIITGKELQQPGIMLQYGQVYESNSFSLSAALQKANIYTFHIYHTDDDLELLTETLRNALVKSDVVLLSGGVSVGDYDFVLKASEHCGVKQLFHKVKQRPGKPLFFGSRDNKLVFGLPGNPSSVLTCFYEYVLPALGLLNRKSLDLQQANATLQTLINKGHSLTHFLKGYYNGKSVLSLDAQESYKLSSFAKANCLIKLDEEIKKYSEGEAVEIHLLPV
jgi:molybdopterin molybdotransferase